MREEDASSEISSRIRYEIEYSGYSKAAIADAIGVSRPTISQYLSGKIQPSLVTLSKLCSFLGCSSDEILGVTHDNLSKSTNSTALRDRK